MILRFHWPVCWLYFGLMFLPFKVYNPEIGMLWFDIKLMKFKYLPTYSEYHIKGDFRATWIYDLLFFVPLLL